MATNPLQHDLQALQRLVTFAEGVSMEMPAVLVESGHGIVTIGSSGLKKAQAMTAVEIEMLRAELREQLRSIARRDSAVITTNQLSFHLVKHQLTTPRRHKKGGRSDDRQIASSIIDGPPRDLFLYLATRVLTTVAIERLEICPDADCGKVFVRVTKKRFCSQRCQSRIYMRQLRAQERVERDAVIVKKRKRA